MDELPAFKWLPKTTPIPPAPANNIYFYSFTNCENPFDDIMFCHLNEIETELIDSIDNIEYETNIEKQKVYDPRNGKLVENFLFDWSSNGRRCLRQEIFNNFARATSLKKYHREACLRYLLAIKNKATVDPNDILIFEKTKKRREIECQLFHDFVQNYVQAHPIKSFTKFEILYKKVLEFYSQEINVNSEIEEPFKILTTLPLLRNIKLNNYEITWKCEADSVYFKGHFPKYVEHEPLYKMRYCLEKFLINLNLFYTLPTLYFKTQSGLEENYDIKINEEALVLLLETEFENANFGEFEIPFSVIEDSIEIFQPLPRRHFDYSTYQNVFNIAFRNFSILNQSYALFEAVDNKFKLIEKNMEEEIEAVDLNQKYDLKVVDDDSGNDLKFEFKPSEIMSKVILEGREGKKYNLCICFKNIGAINILNKLVNINCKLEYKKKFGLEQMTVNELLIECIRTHFLPNSENIRMRVDAETLEILELTTLTETEILNQLSTLYGVDFPRLLSKLHYLIEILKQHPEGKYILKYNPFTKSSDYFIIYNQNSNDTTNNISFKSIFNSSASGVVKDSLPIDPFAISSMHEEIRVLPACFISLRKRRRRNRRQRHVVNDRSKIIQKAQIRRAELKKIQEENQKKKKLAIQARKRAKKQKKTLLRRSQTTCEDLYTARQEFCEESLIDKYSKYSPSTSADYIKVLSANTGSTLSQPEQFDIEKYLADAEGSSKQQNNFTREDYLEIKRTKTQIHFNSSEIEKRKANTICKNSLT